MLTRRRLFELAGMTALVSGCTAVSDALTPSNVSTVVTAIGDVGKVASYVNAIVAAVNAAATFVGITIPAKVATALNDAESIANNLNQNGAVQATQTAVGTILTDIESVVTGFSGNASGDLETALNDAAQLVPEIASVVGLVVSASTPTAMRRQRMGAAEPVTAVLADLHRIAALKKAS